MKKTKFISSVLALAFVVGGGVCLSACGNNETVYEVSNQTELETALAKEEKVVKIKFTDDIVADVEIVEGKKVVIDLNGNKLTNNNEHTIINKGILTIKDKSKSKSGKIDNVTHGKAPLYNEVGAELYVEGGNFTRSLENGKSSSNNGGNSFYVLLNHGKTKITDGKFYNNGAYSSLIENGWFYPSENQTATNAEMIIDGGSFEGGLNTIKNDDYGVMTINGGNFQNKMTDSDVESAKAIILNWNSLTINGGNFKANYCKSILDSGFKGNENYEISTTTINGGNISGNITTETIYNFHQSTPKGEVVGEFTGTVTTNAVANA